MLPEHLRINHPEMTQELIELMNALRKYGLLGDMSISRLARILNCTLCSHYSPTGLQNRLKATPPELEYIDLFVKVLAREIRKNNTPTKNKR